MSRAAFGNQTLNRADKYYQCEHKHNREISQAEQQPNMKMEIGKRPDHSQVTSQTRIELPVEEADHDKFTSSDTFGSWICVVFVGYAEI